MNIDAQFGALDEGRTVRFFKVCVPLAISDFTLGISAFGTL